MNKKDDYGAMLVARAMLHGQLDEADIKNSKKRAKAVEYKNDVSKKALEKKIKKDAKPKKVTNKKPKKVKK